MTDRQTQKKGRQAKRKWIFIILSTPMVAIPDLGRKSEPRFDMGGQCTCQDAQQDRGPEGGCEEQQGWIKVEDEQTR
jgi:hypothetical protein